MALGVAVAVSACSVSEVAFTPLEEQVTIGGMTSGLDGAGLVLSNGGRDDLAISGDGAFVFAIPMQRGASYAVEVKTQPSNPSQICSVSNGVGVAGEAAVTDIQVSCSTTAFDVGGTVTGLAGSGLVLQNNDGDDLEIRDDGSFVFATPIASGSRFAVTVRSQPANFSQTCTVSGGTGVVGAGEVTSIAINCTTNRYTVGGTISGLVGTVVLRNNDGDELDLTANGTFSFSTPVSSGASYSVTVASQPAQPRQTCAVSASSGLVTGDDVTDIVIACTTDRFRVGGTLTGLAPGNSITLRSSGGDDLILSANTSFVFPTRVESGLFYVVTVEAPSSPIAQGCLVNNGVGVIADRDITDVEILCTISTFTIGGVASGVTAPGLVLQNNRGDDLAITGDGEFAFPTRIASGATYAVTVRTQPQGLICTVAASSGTARDRSIISVRVACGDRFWSPDLFPMPVPGTNFAVGDLTLDNNDDLLVVVSNPARAIVRVSRVTGARTTVATGIGVADRFLLGVAYRATNDMIYANTNDNRIFAVTSAGVVTLLTTVPGGTINAIAIAPPSFGSFGDFLIGATSTGTVIAVDPESGAITTIASNTGTASDLAFAPDGTLYVCGVSSISTVTATGVVTLFRGGFSSADGIVIASDNTRMFIADSGTGTVRQVTIPGAVVTTLGPADINRGTFVGGVVATAGNVLIVMTGGGSATLVALSF